MSVTLERTTVSVVIPTYNRRHILPRALASLRAQTRAVEEIVIVDDGSTDGTEALVREWMAADPTIRYIRLDSNRGAQAARVAGIRACRSEWIVFLDSDDEFLPGSVAARLEAAERCGFKAGLVYGDVILDGRLGTEHHNFRRFNGHAYAEICKDLMLANYAATMVRRDCFDTCGYPTESFQSFQDQDLAMLVSRHFPVVHCGETVAISHFTPGQITASMPKLVAGYNAMLTKYWRDVRRYQGLRRLLLCRLYLTRMRLRERQFKVAKRHGQMAAELGRLDPRRVAHAVYARLLRAAFMRLNRFLKPHFHHDFRFKTS